MRSLWNHIVGLRAGWKRQSAAWRRTAERRVRLDSWFPHVPLSLAKEALPITTDFAKREKALDPKLRNSMLSIHAWALCQTGKKDQGVALLDTIIERTKGDDAKSMAMATKARIMQETGDTVLAIEAYEQALKIAKNKHLKNRYTKTLEALKKSKSQK